MKNKVYSLIIILLGAVFLSACANSDITYERGLKAYQEQKYEEAEKQFRRALSQGIKEPAVRADLALTLLQLSRGDEALIELNKAYSSTPEDTEVLKRIGMFYELMEDPYAAVPFYEQAVSIAEGKWTDDSLEAEGLLSLLYKKLGQDEKAIEGFNTLIVQGYHVPEHVLLAGQCYLHEDQIYAATQYFDLLDQCRDSTADHYLTACQSLLEKGAKKEAKVFLEKGAAAIEAGKGTYSVGELYCYAGFYDEAKTYAEGRMDHGAYMTQALIAFHENDMETAGTKASAALSEDPDDIGAYALYLLIKAKTGDESTVKQLLTKINAKGSEKAQADALWNQIVMYEQSGKYDEAFKLLKEYRQKHALTESVRRELKLLSRLED